MAKWPLHTPGRGSVAGLLSVDAPAEAVAGMSPAHHAPQPALPPPAPKKHRSATPAD
jgi:hypothetical protein